MIQKPDLKKCIKKTLTVLAMFVIAQMFFVLFLYAGAKVPKDKIEKNMQISADYLCEKIVFFFMIDDVMPSLIDRYADSITLNIAWNYDEDNALTSAMRADFLSSRKTNENDNFKASVTGNPNETNFVTQYIRYWHGSSALSRIMHVFMSIKQMYILNAVIIALLAAALLAVLLKNRLYDLSAGLVFGLITTSVWFVPLSLEYTWVYIIMLIISLIVVFLSVKGKYGICPYVILASGMFVNFFDFLTAETLTLTVPLLIMLRIRRKETPAVTDKNKKGSLPAEVSDALSCTVLWGFGYVGTWISKWLISSLVLKENVMPYITEHIAERLGGEVYGDPVTTTGMLFGALGRNIANLFPVGYGVTGLMAGIVLLIVLAYIGFVYRKKGYDTKLILYYVIVGLIPYVRYLVLHNHSYIHRFFTFRAQMATMMAVILIICELTGLGLDGNPYISIKKKKRR